MTRRPEVFFPEVRFQRGRKPSGKGLEDMYSALNSKDIGRTKAWGRKG